MTTTIRHNQSLGKTRNKIIKKSAINLGTFDIQQIAQTKRNFTSDTLRDYMTKLKELEQTFISQKQ